MALRNTSGNKVKHAMEFALQIATPLPAQTNIFGIQIGVLEAVEVDLEYKKTNYHLEECIIGKVSIHLAKVDLKKIELFLIKLETYCAGKGIVGSCLMGFV